MGDSINVDWNAAPAPQPTPAAALVAGQQLGQAQAGINALHNVDLNNPDSVSAGMEGLVKAGQIDQGNALMNLNFTRQMRASMMDPNNPLNQYLSGGSVPASASGTSAAPTSGGGQAPQGSAPGTAPDSQSGPSGLQAQAQVLQAATTAAQELKATPPEDRPAKFAQIKAQMTQMGVPEAAIDPWGQDLSDQGLDGAISNLQAHTDHIGALAGGQTPNGPAPDLHQNTYNSVKDLINHPNIMATMEAYKTFGGPDYTPLIQQSLAENMPGITKQAELQYAPAIARSTEAATVDLKPPTPGAQPLMNNQGAVVAWHMPDGAVQTIEQASEAQATGGQAAESAYAGKIAEERAAGSTTGTLNASGEPTTVPLRNGGTITTTPLQAKTLMEQHPEVFGSPSPAATELQTGGAKDLESFVNKAAESNQGLAQTLATGQRITALANAAPTGQYGPMLAQVAKALPLGHNAADYATNSDLLRQDLSASFRGQVQALGGIPRIAGEAKAATGAMGQVTDQADALRLYGASQQAMANYAKRFNDFVTNYASSNPSAPSMADAQAQWISSPQGRASMYADPAFRNLTIGGRPAVVVDPKTGIGVFMPKTPSAFSFRAQ